MNIKTFFNPIHVFPANLPYHEIKPYIEMCDKFSKINNMSVYMIDYAQQGFLHVSSHPLFLSGYTQKEVKEMGMFFIKKCYRPKIYKCY